VFFKILCLILRYHYSIQIVAVQLCLETLRSRLTLQQNTYYERKVRNIKNYTGCGKVKKINFQYIRTAGNFVQVDIFGIILN